MDHKLDYGSFARQDIGRMEPMSAHRHRNEPSASQVGKNDSVVVVFSVVVCAGGKACLIFAI